MTEQEKRELWQRSQDQAKKIRDTYYCKIRAKCGEISDSWIKKLMYMSREERTACIGLLKVKNFRSEFRKSLRGQLENWLNEDTPRYPSPFSGKQWACIIVRF